MSLNGFLKRLLGLFYKKPLCHQLERPKRYKSRYKTWVQRGNYAALTAAFYKAYHYKKSGIKSRFRVQFIKEQDREGAILFYDPAISPEAFSFLFDYIKDKALQQGYHLRSANRRKISNEYYKQHVETYYLTPLPSDLPGSRLCNQLYGNILLDYTLINYHPGFIRIVSNSYSDAHFSSPLPFSELLTQLLQPTEAP